MSVDTEAEAESIVAAYNNATREHAPELSWFGMTAIRDGDAEPVREGFVFDTHGYVDQDGLWRLRQDGRQIEYVEAENATDERDDPRISIVLATLGREVRSL
jgi:hypothetical protein